MTSLRCRLAGDKVKKQVAICHNSTQMARSVTNERNLPAFKMLSLQSEHVPSDPANGDERTEATAASGDCSSGTEWDDIEELFDDDVFELETSTFDASSPSQILEKFLFNEDE